MKQINLHGITQMKPLGGTNSWYFATDYTSGDLYEAEELYRNGHEVKSNHLYLIHYPDGTVIEASSVLQEQDIPAEIRDAFRFHDANVLSVRKIGADAEMLLSDGGFMGTPYCRVIFRNVSLFEREKGLVIRTKRENSGEISSNVIYLYDELYRTESGYEVHMMLTGRQDLRYLTVGCERIEVTSELE